MKLERFLPFITFLGFSVVILLFLAWSQKPLCIDSRAVERIDKLTEQGQESVFRCSQKKRVPFSAFWGQNLASINEHILTSERFLEGIEPFRKKYQITLVGDQGLLYRIRGQQVFVGEKLFVYPGQIERLMVALWVYEKSQGHIEQPDLTREVLIDFLMSMALQKKIFLKNPLVELEGDFTFSQWPVVLRSQHGYCESYWSLPQHYHFCSKLISSQEAGGEDKNQWVEMSLRPYILNQLMQSYADLTLTEKNQIYSNYAKILRSLSLVENDQIVADDVSQTELEIAKNKVFAVGDFLFKSAMEQSVPALAKLASLYKSRVHIDVFEESTSLAKVDVVFEFSQIESQKVDFYLEQLSLWTQKSSDKKIAVLTEDSVYFLPLKRGLSRKQFGSLISKQRVRVSCEDMDLASLVAYENQTDRLLWVHHCNTKESLDFVPFVRTGIESFALNNKKHTFVYFHIPSLLSRKGEIENLGKLLANIKHTQTPLARVLGWQEVELDSNKNFMMPKAYVDGIQFYRLSSDN
ncbi:MAG: hypothetical protein ACLGGX_06010 [Bdellovibrionia bacterium]